MPQQMLDGIQDFYDGHRLAHRRQDLDDRSLNDSVAETALAGWLRCRPLRRLQRLARQSLEQRCKRPRHV